MRYRRNLLVGGTYFFTLTLADRRRSFLTDNIDVLRHCIADVKGRHPFAIDAAVVLPDHIHMIWTLPEDDANYPMRWRLIKSAFSRQLSKTEFIAASRSKKGERGIWQRRYWEHTIQDENDLQRHVDYIYMNPVKHGYVTRAVDWPYSSIHRDIAAGLVCADWGCGLLDCDRGFGE